MLGLAGLVGVVCAAVPPVQSETSGNFLNLSFSGDGHTPTSLELYERVDRQLTQASFAATASPTGDAGWSVPLALPPAIQVPSVGLSYSSAGGYGWVGRGFAVSAGVEIRRPTGPAMAAYADVPGALRVSGAGIDGVLIPDGVDWAWVSDTPGAVVAAYDEVLDTFTLRAGLVTWVLEPRAVVNGREPWHWRTVSQTDTSGNRVDYVWDGDRLDRVAYGGLGLPAVAPAGDEHFLEVAFGYRSAAHAWVRSDQGLVETIDQRLEWIEVRSSWDRVGSPPLLRYDLSYDPADELLERIDEVEVLPDGTDGVSRLLAELTYTSLVEQAEVEEGGPPFISTSLTATSAFGESDTSLANLVVDVSGDALPDAFRATFGAAWQRISRSAAGAVTHWWEDLYAAQGVPHTLHGPSGLLDQSTTVIVYDLPPDERIEATYGIRRLVDMDGDGILDLVATSEVPVGFDQGANPTAQLDNRAPLPTQWQVWYGDEDGFEGAGFGGISEVAPFRFLEIGSRPKLPERPLADHDPSYTFEGPEVDLVDVDGDGWLDVVEVLWSGLWVYRRIPVRGAGWEPVATLALDEPIGSLSSSTGYVVDAWDEPAWEYFPGHLQVTPTLEYMEVHTGLLDLNGDGVVDWVDTRSWSTSSPEWQVWFGTGAAFALYPEPWAAPVSWHARSYEGQPWVKACSVPPADLDLLPPLDVVDIVGRAAAAGPTAGLCHTVAGFHQAQLGGLLDLDGDQRQDLVVGENGEWFRNEGDGFSAALPLPTWFPEADADGLIVPVLSVSGSQQTVLASDASTAHPPPPADVNAGGAVHRQLLSVTDVDGDGLPDVIDRRDAEAVTVTYSGRSVDGDGVLLEGGTRPGLLASVTLGGGASTELSYVPSTELEPSGTTLPHTTRSRKDVLAALELFDPVTGFGALREMTYSDGVTAHGEWWGFGEVREDESVWEPDLATGVAPTDWEWIGATETAYDLDRDHRLPAQRTSWTDRAAAWLGFGTLQEEERYRLGWTYEDQGTGPIVARWPVSVTATEWSQERTDLLDPPTSRTMTVHTEYDAVGNVEGVRHEAPSRPDDRIEVRTTWVADPTGSWWVPREKTTWSVDPLVPNGLMRVESGELSYDGGDADDPPTVGAITGQRVCGGLADGDLCDPVDELVWEFDRTPRGAVSLILAPAGRNTSFELYGFGDVAVLDQENALGHEILREIDPAGRVVSETDPNGVQTWTTTDGFGRVVREERQGAGSTLRMTTFEVVYHDADFPRWSETVRYTTGSAGLVTDTRVEYTVTDGFGRPTQTWTEKLDQSGFVVTETERDPRGAERIRSEPHEVAAFSTDFWATRAGATRSWAHHDAFGDLLVSWDVVGGLTSAEWSEPGTRRTIDASGYSQEEVHDTHGRLIEVRQGQPADPDDPAQIEVTARYRYDGLARVREFVDGAGNAHRYQFDGAGRARRVWRRPAGSLIDETYVEVVWDGPDPVELYQGSAAAGMLASTWTYDDLGRTTEKRVWDPVTSVWQTYRWTWDRDPLGVKPTWYGARQGTTDPSGSTSYRYDPDPVVGGFGWPTQILRIWPGRTVMLGYDYDPEGRVTSATWPSGASVATTYHPSGAPDTQVLTWSMKSATATHLYDDLDRSDGWELTSGVNTWTQDITRGPGGEVSGLDWTELPGSGDHAIAYQRQSNGWLDWKQVDNLEPFAWRYDALGRVSAYFQGGDRMETYTWDAASNPTEMFRYGEGTWAYDPSPRFNEVPLRVRNVPGFVDPVRDEMVYDPVTGGLLSWETDHPDPALDVLRQFEYDGAGRLRWAWHQGPPATQTAHLFYDGDDALVLERRTTNGVTKRTWRYGGWRQDEGGQTFEQVLPMARLESGNLRVVYLEPDGHAHWTLASAPAAQQDTEEFVGVFGLELLRFASTPDWALDGYHGSEPDRNQEAVQFGARHMVLRDGMWMQPEPLLYLGLTNGDLANPLGYAGLYSAGNPNVYADPTGQFAVPAVLAAAGGLTATQAAVCAAAATTAVTAAYIAVDPQGAELASQHLVNAASFVGEGLAQAASSVGSNVSTAIAAGVSLAQGAKRGPKTDPAAPHNAKIRAEAGDLEVAGNEIVAGGGKTAERLIPTPGGAKSGRRPDILYKTPAGELRGRNVGKTRADGTPVKREVEALDDLNKAGVPTDFVPYD